jgi:hypothetical protein
LENNANGSKQKIKLIDDENKTDRGELYVEISIIKEGAESGKKEEVKERDLKLEKERKEKEEKEKADKEKADKEKAEKEKAEKEKAKSEETKKKEETSIIGNKLKITILNGNLYNLKGEDDEGLLINK